MKPVHYPSRSPWGRLSGPHGIGPIGRVVSWGIQFSVEEPVLDAQHQAIFRLVSDVHELWHAHSDLTELRALVRRLATLLTVHFRHEEEILGRAGFPRLEAHAAEHRRMLRELAAIEERLSLSTGTAYSEPGWVVLNFLLGVTVGHILGTDLDYRDYMIDAPAAAAREGGLATVS